MDRRMNSLHEKLVFDVTEPQRKAVNIIIIDTNGGTTVSTPAGGNTGARAGGTGATRYALSLEPVRRLVGHPALVLERGLDLDITRHGAVRKSDRVVVGWSWDERTEEEL
ncbi:hypothetical protein RSOL_506280 [Rhizoctonia solani AG-3 Rhs1AP]|uniref:Uncharacterized protein n=1 Tax=Rhizoctonia solani AG-3 Rhs1AP TaxID=1086054 RepID=X8JSS6_9AGAM|nr:hypothetical protein RSOL_506280 [Rhizoctonia solani AG-3 Rhs1AP]